MKIINVIEIVEGSVTNVKSFPIVNPLDEKERVLLAESVFAKIAEENGAPEEEMESFLEDGSFSEGDYSVFLSWSEVE